MSLSRSFWFTCLLLHLLPFRLFSFLSSSSSFESIDGEALFLPRGACARARVRAACARAHEEPPFPFGVFLGVEGVKDFR